MSKLQVHQKNAQKLHNSIKYVKGQCLEKDQLHQQRVNK